MNRSHVSSSPARRIAGVMFLLTASFSLCHLAGCSARLEDGYEPHKLGVSSNERRAYYASPFTPEAHAAQQDRDADMSTRRPGSY